MDGLKAATISDAGIFQDCAPSDGSGNSDHYRQAGKTYTLTAAISLRPDVTAPPPGRTLRLRFFLAHAGHRFIGQSEKLVEAAERGADGRCFSQAA